MSQPISITSINTMQFQICKIGIPAMNTRGTGLRHNILSVPHVALSSTTSFVEEYST